MVKPIEFVYEDTEFCDESRAEAWGVFNTTPIPWTMFCKQNDGTIKEISEFRDAYAYEWFAAFRNKDDALVFCKERNS